MKKQKLLIIVGPTASGKTDLGIVVAKKLNGEIISADSRAVYKGLTIGANIPSKKEQSGIPHHLFEVFSPRKVFTANDFVRLADNTIADISKRGKLPIIVGGTGLYIDALLRRITVPEVPPNTRLRRELEKKSAEELFKLLKKLDPRRAKNIEQQNPRRLMRAIEIAKAIGTSPLPKPGKSPYEATIIGLLPTEKILEKKITARAKIQVRRGLIAETKRLREKQKLSWKRINELGFEYRLAGEVLQGSLKKSELAEKLAAANKKYAKRQVRYLKRNPQILWRQSLTKGQIYDLLNSV